VFVIHCIPILLGLCSIKKNQEIVLCSGLTTHIDLGIVEEVAFKPTIAFVESLVEESHKLYAMISSIACMHCMNFA
jgi:hypothetical protein